MIKPSVEGFKVLGTFNPGATRFKDEIILLLRVAETYKTREGYIGLPQLEIENDHPKLTGYKEIALDDPNLKRIGIRGFSYKGINYLSTISHLRIARSKDGVSFSIDDQPFISPSEPEDIYGVEDARITLIDETYYITYTSVSPEGCATSLASTKDFKTVSRHGIIFPPMNKDVSIFPEKINGLYRAFHRPDNSGLGKPSIWYAQSPDLLNWGGHRCMLKAHGKKIGGGAPSIKTPEGWLHIYHSHADRKTYSLFSLLLDLDNPHIVHKRSKHPILMPKEDYEMKGFWGHVVFCNGIINTDDNRILIYYGACDETTCVAETTISELMASF